MTTPRTICVSECPWLLRLVTIAAVPLLVALSGSACAPTPDRDPNIDARALEDFQVTAPPRLRRPTDRATRDDLGKWLSELDSPSRDVATGARVALLSTGRFAARVILSSPEPRTTAGKHTSLAIVMAAGPQSLRTDNQRSELRRRLSTLLTTTWDDTSGSVLSMPSPAEIQERTKLQLDCASWLQELAVPEDSDVFVRALRSPYWYVRQASARALIARMLTLTPTHMEGVLGTFASRRAEVRELGATLMRTISSRLTMLAEAALPPQGRLILNPHAPEFQRSQQSQQWQRWIHTDFQRLRDEALKVREAEGTSRT